MTLTNGTQATYLYDAVGQVTRVANLKSDATVLSKFDYGYDAAGNRVHVVEADGNRVTWSYDNVYRLTRQRRSGADSYDITYTYDPVGNRLTGLENTVTTTYGYDVANQLITEKDNTGTTTYSYDADGNQVVKNAPGALTSSTWDYENRLARTHLPAGTLHTSTYNADGLRVEQQDAGAISKSVWDEENLLLETDASDVTQVIYTLNPEVYGNQLSQRRSGTTHYYLFDGLGSTDRLTDAAENVTDTYKYKAFGSLLTSTGSTTNPFRYVGQLGYYYHPASELYYVRARWLAPSIGRWVSRDPLATDLWDRTDLLEEAELTSLYLYLSGNPIDGSDPTGLIGISPKDRDYKDKDCNRMLGYTEASIKYDYTVTKDEEI